MASSTSSSGPPALSTVQTGEANIVLWYLDSTATSHIIPLEGILSNKLPYNGTSSVFIGNGTQLPNHHIGQVSLSTSAKPLKLNNVLHVF